MKLRQLLIGIAAVTFSYVSCTKLDNYPAPNSGIYGTLTDAETGEFVSLIQGGGSIRLLEQNTKYPSPSPIDLAVNSGSGYYATQLFADQYKAFPLALSGPFVYPSLDTVLITLKPGSMTQVNFQVIPYYRIKFSVSDSTFTYTITSSNANTATGAQLQDVFFMISQDSALNHATAGNLPGQYYPNRFPLATPSNAILGVQQTFTIPFASTQLPKGTYYFRIMCDGSKSNAQYNYSSVVQATVH
jgi:hypothetical protein